jgi:hypothetical protein
VITFRDHAIVPHKRHCSISRPTRTRRTSAIDDMAIPYAAATPCPPQTLAASEYFGFDSSSPRAVVASAIVLQPDHSSIAATAAVARRATA